LQLVACVLALAASEPLWAVAVPSVAPKSLKETQDPDAVAEHEKAAAAEAKKSAAPVISQAWIEQIQKMAQSHSKRDAAPAEKFDVVFSKKGTVTSFNIRISRNANRTPNDANQMHGICNASFDGRSDKLKLDGEGVVDGPDLYELFGVDQLKIVCDELIAIRRLQLAFIKVGLNYTLEAGVIVAPDGKSWAWEIGPSEEQSPNVIYGINYYPATHELHSVHLDNKKAAAKLQQAAAQAGMQLKWVQDMRER